MTSFEQKTRKVYFSSSNESILTFILCHLKMGDAVKKPLKIPSWHIPYLEKHRIFELFHELARELVIQQPDDHLMFIKQILYNAEMSRNTARVILLGSPKINCLEVAKYIAEITKQIVITDNSLLVFKKDIDGSLTSEEKAKYISYLVRKDNAHAVGWILLNIVQDAKDAKALISKGILPTHVLFLIPPFNPPISELIYCHVPNYWPEYRRTMHEIKQVFKKVIVEIYLKNRNLQEIVNECVELISIQPGKVAIKPKIVIIGPRGSGRKTQAKYLEENLNLVHIDFESLICECWMSESELSKKLHGCKDEVCFHSELLAQVINKRVLENDCLEHGWVLTGFPYSRRDMEYLDTIDTPPNRILFLDCEISICKERLLQWKINIHTGSLTDITKYTEDQDNKELKAHPKNNEEFIDAELSYYCEKYGDLRKYCGSTAHCINADQSERWIYESILAVIIRAPPPVLPRIPFENMSATSVTSSDSCCCSPIPSQVFDCYITNKD